MPNNKVRRNGSYAPLSAHAYKDDAVAQAGEAAELLYYRGLSFCADVLSDGYISDLQLQRHVGVGMRDVKRRAQRLIEVGLWVREDAGYRVRSWLKWNRSREEIETDLRKDSGRKADKPPAESSRNPNGIRTSKAPPSERIPPSRAPSISTPLHSKSSEPDGSGSAAINAGTVAGAWVEAMNESGTKPTSGMRGQVGKLAKELLDAGNDPLRVLAAAQQAGRAGYATIDRELAVMNGRRPAAVQGGIDPTTGRRWEQ